jgi:beta-glucosidase
MSHVENQATMSQIDQRIEEILSQMTLQEKVALMSGKDVWNTVSIERLGIPSITMTDGPHGVRASDPSTGRKLGPATSYPTGISMAASWNPDLIEEVGAALADETRHMGCHILLGPCVNIVRTPLGGRNFEAYSEDPFLAGEIGKAWVKGLQSRNIGASLKHYALNNQEINRNRGNSVVDERTMREIYLPAFEKIVKETQPWTVMCSYNKINGEYASENGRMLTDILRDEWGFEGVLITDWGANHSTIPSKNAGMDIEMPGPAKYYGKLLLEAVHNWQVEQKTIDDSARRILRLVLTAVEPKDNLPHPEGAGNTPENRLLARRLAEESITLLKNDNNVLPLKRDQINSLAVIGPNAAEARIGGGGSSYLEPHYRISPLDGIRALAGDSVEIAYAKGCDNLVQPPAIPSRAFNTPGGNGHGLRAEFFNNLDFSGQPVISRIDPHLNQIWFSAPPDAGIHKDHFSARWTGAFQVERSGYYTLMLGNTDLARLYLDNQLLVENDRRDVPAHEIVDHPTSLISVIPIVLEAGKPYDMRVDYIKTSRDDFAGIRLMYIQPPEEDDPIGRAVDLARQADAAVIFAGMPTYFETEGDDRPDLELPGQQTELIRAVAAVNKKTIVVINAGAPVSMPWLNEVAVVLESYYPGQEGGSAVARVLFGEINPSGRLPVTFPKRLEDTPAFIHYPGARDVIYGEGIFVGYRYYDTRDIEPLFPFGFGLSYTTFEYNQLDVPKLINLGDPLTFTLTVTNTGPYAGQEVVQIYVADETSSVKRPPKELKSFQKVALDVGESRTLTFTLDQRALSFYDPYQKDWVAEPGKFEILAGSSSRDIHARAVFVLQ